MLNESCIKKLNQSTGSAYVAPQEGSVGRLANSVSLPLKSSRDDLEVGGERVSVFNGFGSGVERVENAPVVSGVPVGVLEKENYDPNSVMMDLGLRNNAKKNRNSSRVQRSASVNLSQVPEQSLMLSPMSSLTVEVEQMVIDPPADSSYEGMDVDSGSNDGVTFTSSAPLMSVDSEDVPSMRMKRSLSQSQNVERRRKKPGSLKKRVTKTNSFDSTRRIIFQCAELGNKKSEFLDSKIKLKRTISVTPTLQRAGSFNLPNRTDSERMPSPVRKRVKKEQRSYSADTEMDEKKRRRKLAKSARFSRDYQDIFEENRSENIPYFRRDAFCRITCETAVELIEGVYGFETRLLFLDCRYEYEFNGGHVSGAQNLPIRECLDKLFENPPTDNDPKIIVFYCEFSSERAPKAYNYLRKLDRRSNDWNLRYPDLYLLDGGYSNFFERERDTCEPQGYVKMLDRRYLDQCHINTELSDNNF